MSPSSFRCRLAAVTLSFAAPLAAQLVGPPFPVGPFSSVHTPAVAFDNATQRYVVVYAVATGTTTAEIRGQFVMADGSLFGLPVLIEADADPAVPPVVCNVNRTDKFVVGYRRKFAGGIIPSDTNWYVRTLTDWVAGLSNRVLVPFDVLTTGSLTEMVLGGDARHDPFDGGDDRALLVVRRGASLAGSNSVAFAMVDTTGADPTVGPFTTLTAPSASVRDIAVTANAGTLDPIVGRWLVVWCQSATAGSYTQVRGRLVDTDGNLCGPSSTLYSGFTPVGRPSVAGRTADEFAVAWQHGSDVRVRPVSVVGACGSNTFVTGAVVDPASSSDNAEPVLVRGRHKYLLAWRHSPSGFPSTVLAKSLDPTTCVDCGQEWVLEYDGAAQREPAVVARASANDTASSEALVVWTDGTLGARRFETIGNDLVVDVGGGCVDTGFTNVASYADEMVIGNPNFRFVLATPTVPVLALILGLSAIDVSCGSCTLVPSIDIVLPGASPTIFPLPCDPLLIGVDLWSQWLLLKPSDCPALPDYSFSNALRFTIGE